ncbi:MAG: arginine--tRNA ligase [Clostridiales bacterium]|nr:arginine--tRNA ligase [Clostridiales bacterium]
MANMIEAAKLQIDSLVRSAYAAAVEKGELPEGVELTGAIEIPKDAKLGDYACSYAMAAAKAMHMAPRKIADALLANLELEGSYFASAEVAGAGFINFRLADSWYAAVLEAIEADGSNYGSINVGKGEKVMVEFVSANPTGPMHMGNARGGVLGDSLAEVLHRAGYNVWREFYVNDAGNQINKFAQSIDARYQQIILGEDKVEFPEDGYHGDDIKDIAKAFYEANGDKYLNAEQTERYEAMSRFGLDTNIPKMQSDLKKYHIEYDEWFFESSLHESGYVAETVELLGQNGWTYEKDGALWLKTADLLRQKAMNEGKTKEQADKLDLKDDVLRRANGFYTYFAADIAYHRNKFAKRGFDKVINIWGADHHGHVARLQAALDGLGLDGSRRLVVVLMQLVNLLQDGKPVRMSKRTGKTIALADLLDEISVDAARYFFNAKPDTHLDFDLGLAVREDSENPVYYIQYAHARICSLVAALAAEGSAVAAAKDIDVSKLAGDNEHELIKQLSLLPEEIRLSARDYDPSRINRYLVELASRFHRFYNSERIKGAEPEVLAARLKLADSVRSVIAAALGILGVTAPEKM